MNKYSTKQMLIIGGGGVLILVLVLVLGFAMWRGLKKGDFAAETRRAYGQQNAGAQPVKATPSPVAPPSVLTTTPDGTNVAPPNPNLSASKGATFRKPEDKPATVTFQPDTGASTDPALVATPIQAAPPPVPDFSINGNFPNGRTREGNNGVSTASYVDPRRYLFNNQSPEATSGKALIAGEGEGPQVSIHTFAPVGETIELVILDNATTNNSEIDVSAAVWQPFYFQGNLLLRRGDKLLGRAAPGKQRDRMIIKWYKVIFVSGKSLPIVAVAQDVDGSYGVKGFLVGNAVLSSLTPILLNMAVAMVSSMQQPTLQSLLPQNVSLSVGGSSVGSSASQNLTNQGYTAIQGGLGKISDLLATDIEENKPYIVVAPGTRCRAYLQNYIDVSAADYAK